VTGVDINAAVQITSYDESTVTVALTNAWTSEGDVDRIWYSYKYDDFGEKCYAEAHVPGGDHYEEITIQCFHSKAFAELEICVADELEFDEVGDNATIPECCHNDLTVEVPTVCYEIAVNCVTVCPDTASERALSALRGAKN